MGLNESARARIGAPADQIFNLITDVARLPQWNSAITDVVHAPERLEGDAVWKVRIHAMGTSWVSRSELIRLDRTQRVFEYRSQSDDGNPSFADWTWRVSEDGDGALVDVDADLNPKTFWRKHLLIRLRRPGLRKEMRASLTSLGELVAQST